MVTEPATIRNAFETTFKRPPTTLARAPGRLEILGNHTDYNEGVVLSAAIDRHTYFAAAPRTDGQCFLSGGEDVPDRSFSAEAPAIEEKGDWSNYVKGVILELREQGIKVPGFDGYVCGDVPVSAGMSSSAALEMSVLYGLLALSGETLDPVDCARLGQRCENIQVGAPTGLLDQLSSVMGSAGQFVFIDFRSMAIENIFVPEGIKLVVANSMVKHDLTEEYTERREACEEAVETLQKGDPSITALRGVTPEGLENRRDSLSTNAYRRARHVVEEIDRVYKGKNVLGQKDVEQFGALMYESHESSRKNFENSCPELDQLVEIGRSLPGALGARLSGGGFGGITVHLVQADQAEDYVDRLAEGFETLSGIAPQTMICTPGGGAEILNPNL